MITDDESSLRGNSTMYDRPSVMEVLRQSELITCLPAHCQDGLLDEGHLQFAQRGESIYRVGDPALFAGLVGTGFVRISKPIHVGHESIVQIAGPGQTFALKAAMDLRPLKVNIVAATPTWFLKIPVHVFGRSFHDGVPISELVLESIAPRIEQARQFHYRVAKGNVPQRLAVVLLTLADSYGRQTGNGTLLSVPLTRQDLAEMAGTTLETTNRVVSQWQKAGVVRSERGSTQIYDHKALESLVPD